MNCVQVLGTGGTIASRAASGGSVVADSTTDVVESTGLTTQVRVRDILHINSFHLTFADLLSIHAAVAQAVADPAVDGVVITHGTDTMEETAFFLSLFHDSQKPVVLTGAQRAADLPHTDGPENLRQAILAAGSPAMRGTGVTIGFASQFHAARHTRKRHTLATTAFAGGTLVATFYHDALTRLATPVTPPVLAPPPAGFGQLSVPLIDAAPGTDAALFLAALQMGVDGIILQGVGAGNAPPAYTPAVEQAVRAGVPVVLTTRVPAGPVAAIYGNGGAVTLLEAGALNAHQLNTYQARLLVGVLIAQGLTGAQLHSTFAAQAI